MLDYYMELIIQFGYIVLFSSVFPLAGLMSLISNSLQIHSQVSNFKYTRRFKPDVSNGIGNWESCLYQLTQFSIIVNSSIIFFTSKMYYKMFVTHKEEAEKDHEGIRFETGWGRTQFLIFVVIVEHIMIILKMVVEQFIEDTPLFVVRGERTR